MRLAVYGLVERDAGSVASANFLVLEELLARGHEVHFYAISNFVRPAQLIGRPGFHYHGLVLETYQRLRQRLHGIGGQGVERLVSEVAYGAHLRALRDLAAAHHRAAPFDGLIFLGVGTQFRVPGLPTVGWAQSPAQTEWEAIRRLRGVIVRVCGWGLFARLAVFYTFKRRAMQRELRRSDVVVVGSEWSRRKVIETGIAPERVFALPYPFDLGLFTPGEAPPPDAPKTFVWLGRVDPRKRLDLMLDAFAALCAERADVRLEIHGRLNYAPQYRALIEAFPYPDRLVYTEGLPRAAMPAKMRAAVALVQPSESENFGSSVAEALACGTPVVLGPTNGTADFVDDAAFRFDAYTPASLAGALRACLAAHAADADGVRSRARAAAERHFPPAVVVAGLERAVERARDLAAARTAVPAPRPAVAG